MRDTIDMLREAGWASYASQDERFKAFEALVRADEREIVMNEPLTKAQWQRFENEIRADEREQIEDEWSMCVQSDLEHGVKSLNEQAAKEWRNNYPEIAKFGAWLAARENT